MSFFKKKFKFWTACDFLLKMTVIVEQLFMGAFCHQVTFIFLKSTLNSTFFFMYDITGS
jgi:hypothetical protein